MKKIIFILILIIIGIGITILILINNDTDRISNNSIDKNLVKCISENSVVYISSGCVACEKQEKLFGESFKELNVIDCVFESEKCREANITAVPAWFIDEKSYKGVQSIEKLKELTGC